MSYTSHQLALIFVAARGATIRVYRRSGDVGAVVAVLNGVFVQAFRRSTFNRIRDLFGMPNRTPVAMNADEYHLLPELQACFKDRATIARERAANGRFA